MTVATLPQLGDVLPNEATVLAYKPNGDGTGIVLAFTGPDYYEPFVTWFLRQDDRVTTSGHYFKSITDAAIDYAER